MGMTYRQLATGLGISRSRVAQLVAEGMPTDSVAAAERWRRENLHPSWARKHPPAEAQIVIEPEDPAPPFDPIEHVLCHVAFPLLIRPELLAIAAREAGIPATGEQVLRAAGYFALLAMDQIGQALEKAGLRFEVSHFPGQDTPERAALEARLGAILGGSCPSITGDEL